MTLYLNGLDISHNNYIPKAQDIEGQSPSMNSVIPSQIYCTEIDYTATFFVYSSFLGYTVSKNLKILEL